MSDLSTLSPDVLWFPKKLQGLFRPHRYKVLHGGRGGAKSWGAARALLIKGATEKLRVLCAREFQNSIKDSVHKLLSDQIDGMGLAGFYDIQQTVIRGRNGTEFSFEGLRHNVTKIKSLEGVDIAWVEEAQTVSKTSWDTLIPTIRKEGSEIWVTFNPELDTDETYKRFVFNPPPDAFVERVNWQDNPWFPDVLRQEKDLLRERDPDAYLTIWEGRCRQTLEGAIYAKEIREATEEGRISRVPYDRSKPVSTFWDLGWRDLTSIWFAQIVGFEFRIIDFVQNRQKTVGHFLKILQDRGYVYGTDWLPHDGESEQLAADGRSIETQMKEAGRKVRIVPKLSPTIGINAARTIFPNCWFDLEKTADGMQALRRYCYEVNSETGQYSRNQLHDENSHAADAFRYMAVAFKEPKDPTKVRKIAATYQAQPGGWMR